MRIQPLMALVVLSLATVPGARAAVLAGPLTNAANGHTYYLLSANWQPIWTNTLPGASADFVDPQWINQSRRFYRARSN